MGTGPGGAGGSAANGGHGTWGDRSDLRSSPTTTRGTLYGEVPTGSNTSNTQFLQGMGKAVAADVALQALRTGTWNGWTLGMGGGGAASGSTDGRDGGPGIVRISGTTFTESTNRDLRAESAGASTQRLGSGGGYYAVSLQGYTLSSGTTIRLGSNSTNTNVQLSGQGRMTLFTVNDPTISGTVQQGITTEFQIYPAIPFGGALVSG